MKQTKLIAPAFAAAMLLTGCGGRNHNDNIANDRNRVDNAPATTATPQQQQDNDSSIRRSNESAVDDMARTSDRVRDNIRDDNHDNNRVENAVSDIAEGGRKLASDVVSDAREAVNDVVDGREDNDGTYRADENGNVNN
ncbi:MAG: hypothetical protein V3G42_02345 [Oscillospiraceae bacterium]